MNVLTEVANATYIPYVHEVLILLIINLLPTLIPIVMYVIYHYRLFVLLSRNCACLYELYNIPKSGTIIKVNSWTFTLISSHMPIT